MKNSRFADRGNDNCLQRQRHLGKELSIGRSHSSTQPSRNRCQIPVGKWLNRKQSLVDDLNDDLFDDCESSFHNHHEYIVHELCLTIRNNDLDALEDLLLYVIRDPMEKYMNSFRYRSRYGSSN